jgi:hypothetical protein
MASYTVTGHPLNYVDLADDATPADLPAVTAALRNNGIGATVTLTLSGASVTKGKGHGVFK